MDRKEYIRYRVKKSDEVYEDAVILAERERWNSCLNRLYYSSYYLVSALLYQNQINPVTHTGTKTQFFLHFVKSDLIEKRFGKLYSHLFDWRQETDYGDFIDFDEKTVTPLVEEVKEFNKQLKQFIE